MWNHYETNFIHNKINSGYYNKIMIRSKNSKVTSVNQIHSKSFLKAIDVITNVQTSKNREACTRQVPPTQQQALWSPTYLLSKSKRSLSLSLSLALFLSLRAEKIVQFRGYSVALRTSTRFSVLRQRESWRAKEGTDARNISSISCHGWPISPISRSPCLRLLTREGSTDAPCHRIVPISTAPMAFCQTSSSFFCLDERSTRWLDDVRTNDVSRQTSKLPREIVNFSSRRVYLLASLLSAVLWKPPDVRLLSFFWVSYPLQVEFFTQVSSSKDEVGGKLLKFCCCDRYDTRRLYVCYLSIVNFILFYFMYRYLNCYNFVKKKRNKLELVSKLGDSTFKICYSFYSKTFLYRVMGR
mgnify:CR=1 FL=1